MNRINPKHEGIRDLLRVVGILLVTAGGIFLIVGLVDFFRAFGGNRPPELFWCAFVGILLLGLGLTTCRFAFLGMVSRYIAGEVAPVAKDTFNYLADETSEGVRTIAKSIDEGIGGHNEEPMLIRCHKCNTINPADARFCRNCGVPLKKTRPCKHCGELNDPDAKFCDNCGKPMD